jgi:hypothetical protein
MSVVASDQDYKSIAKRKPRKKRLRGFPLYKRSGESIMDGRIGCDFRRCRLFVFVNVIFYLFCHVILRILEFADAFSKTTHQFRNLLTTKQKQHYKCDEYDMRTAE